MNLAQRRLYKEFRKLKSKYKAGAISQVEVARLDTVNKLLAQTISKWRYVPYPMERVND